MDVLTFDYTTLLVHSFDLKYIICTNNMSLLKDRFYTLSEVFIVELLLTTVMIYQLYEYLQELMKQNERITTKGRCNKKRPIMTLQKIHNAFFVHRMTRNKITTSILIQK